MVVIPENNLLKQPQGISPYQGYHSCRSLELLWWKKEEDEKEDVEEDVQKQENQNTKSSHMKPNMQHGSNHNNKVRQKTPTLRCQT